MKTVYVELGERRYPIHIGQNLLGHSAFIQPHLAGEQVLVVTNETIAPLYLEKTLNALQPPLKVASVILPDGETYKTLTILNQIFDRLLEQRFDRQATLIALGGGVIGDMTGFAAACYQRGVAFIQIPTTLLAQVDSSVGGKTGVNHPLGKNMIGAFYQPHGVLIDLESLQTLDERQFKSGLAEVIKYGLIDDSAFFEWLEQHQTALLARDAHTLTEAIARCCANKARIVAADEREAGHRALLNLGHTFGHAIEVELGYGQYLHGEAVAVGLCLAAQLSHRLGGLAAAEVERIIQLLSQVGLPTTIPAELTATQLFTAMQVDKKVRHGQVRLVLLKAIGQALLTADYNPDLLQQTLEQKGA